MVFHKIHNILDRFSKHSHRHVGNHFPLSQCARYKCKILIVSGDNNGLKLYLPLYSNWLDKPDLREFITKFRYITSFLLYKNLPHISNFYLLSAWFYFTILNVILSFESVLICEQFLIYWARHLFQKFLDNLRYLYYWSVLTQNFKFFPYKS